VDEEIWQELLGNESRIGSKKVLLIVDAKNEEWFYVVFISRKLLRFL